MSPDMEDFVAYHVSYAINLLFCSIAMCILVPTLTWPQDVAAAFLILAIAPEPRKRQR